ncbi:Peptidyl-tRNA hydrolase ict1, mitochondrial [Chytridiales sp. JEL 0842]|nr:Peptidyl-tRNA hydrolase ict1, mitochondrial [Chytridiales sp. JEL 0842]
MLARRQIGAQDLIEKENTPVRSALRQKGTPGLLKTDNKLHPKGLALGIIPPVTTGKGKPTSAKKLSLLESSVKPGKIGEGDNVLNPKIRALRDITNATPNGSAQKQSLVWKTPFAKLGVPSQASLQKTLKKAAEEKEASAKKPSQPMSALKSAQKKTPRMSSTKRRTAPSKKSEVMRAPSVSVESEQQVVPNIEVNEESDVEYTPPPVVPLPDIPDDIKVDFKELTRPRLDVYIDPARFDAMENIPPLAIEAEPLIFGESPSFDEDLDTLLAASTPHFDCVDIGSVGGETFPPAKGAPSLFKTPTTIMFRFPAVIQRGVCATTRFLSNFKIHSIPKEQLEFSFSRSGGPGGQNVNKVSTKVDLRFDIKNVSWIPENVRGRIVEQFVITSDRYRTQAQNIEDCMQKLYEMIRAAAEAEIPKEPSEEQLLRIKEFKAEEKERKIKSKQHRSKAKSERKFGRYDD